MGHPAVAAVTVVSGCDSNEEEREDRAWARTVLFHAVARSVPILYRLELQIVHLYQLIMAPLPSFLVLLVGCSVHRSSHVRCHNRHRVVLRQPNRMTIKMTMRSPSNN